MKYLLIFSIGFLIFFPCTVQAHACEKVFFVEAVVYLDFYFKNEKYSQPADKVRKDARTKITSRDPEYIDALYNFLCMRNFAKADKHIDTHANYIVIDLEPIEPDESTVTYTSDGGFLYTNDGKKLKLMESSAKNFTLVMVIFQ